MADESSYFSRPTCNLYRMSAAGKLEHMVVNDDPVELVGHQRAGWKTVGELEAASREDAAKLDAERLAAAANPAPTGEAAPIEKVGDSQLGGVAETLTAPMQGE